MDNKDFKKTVGKVWGKVKKISKEAYEKSKEYAIIAELKIKNKSLQKEKNRIFNNIGETVFELIKEKEKNIEEKEQILSRYREIENINEKINEIKLEIKRVKEEYNLKEEEIEKMDIEGSNEEEIEKEDIEEESEEKKKDEKMEE